MVDRKMLYFCFYVKVKAPSMPWMSVHQVSLGQKFWVEAKTMRCGSPGQPAFDETPSTASHGC